MRPTFFNYAIQSRSYLDILLYNGSMPFFSNKFYFADICGKFNILITYFELILQKLIDYLQHFRKNLSTFTL